MRPTAVAQWSMALIPKWRAFLVEVFNDRRLVFMLALGFSSGLPFLLIFSTLSAWLKLSGISRAEIGLFSYVALAYTFKFVWAPFIDALDVPVLARLVGRRRAWMLLAQLMVALGLIAVALGDPAGHPLVTAACALFIAFAAATQDVVIDAWRIDSAPPERQGIMSATYQLGYRLALLCAGAGALFIADGTGFRAAYLVMSLLMAVGVAACLLAPMPPQRPQVREVPRGGTLGERVEKFFVRSFFEPLADMYRRMGLMIVAILVLVALYRLPDFITGVMANPFYIDMGFTLTEIATVSKIYGVWIGLAGAFAGAVAVTQLGLMPSLFAGGIAASASHLAFALLATQGHKIEFLVVAISIENFSSGFAGTALIAYMSNLTSPAFAATQYALLSSLYALPGKVIGGLSGYMVDALGYVTFYALSSTIGIPVVILSVFVWHRTTRKARKNAEQSRQAATAAEGQPVAKAREAT